MERNMIAFGPVPSRRLGASMGINNIPPKNCSYSCVYCQLGRSKHMQVERKIFYSPEEVFEETARKVHNARERGEIIDYLSFVPDGEPTLDINLGREIELLKSFGIRVAVITNSTLLSRSDVRNDLMKADWVSVKIDSASEDVWRKINRPHHSLELDEVLKGISEFSGSFEGELVTETMLVRGINDGNNEIERTADFIAQLSPKRTYLSIPTRPPAEKWVCVPDETSMNDAFQIFSGRGLNVEHLIGYEGNEFAFTGRAEEDLLGITSVHPMREEAVQEFLKKVNADWGLMDRLMKQGKILKTSFGGKFFFSRRLSNRNLQ